MVVALLEDISKGLDDSSNMPTQEAHAEMEDAKVLMLCIYCVYVFLWYIGVVGVVIVVCFWTIVLVFDVGIPKFFLSRRCLLVI